jgi:hypothetical protein
LVATWKAWFAGRLLIIRALITRDGAANRFALTDEGRAMLEALLMRAATRG